MEKGELLFVYGTLKRGFGNHYFLRHCEFLGEGETVEKYAMYICGVPYVVSSEKVSTIKGELYRVGEKVLKEIDRLEGHPWGYKREKIKVCLEDGSIVFAWMYFGNGIGRGRMGILRTDGRY